MNTDNKFQIGQLVRKTKGSEWQGRIVGTYSTTLTPEGYAVESDAHPGSVQIYPAGALEIAAPVVQGEPVGKVRTVGGYPDESEHTVHWLCKYKDLKDGDYLYAAHQPAQDVAGLVEALEDAEHSLRREGLQDSTAYLIIKTKLTAMAAHRKGGDV